MPLRPRLTCAAALLILAFATHTFAQPAAAPPIRLLVPGFTVRQLPLSLTNINNLEYTPDGRLWALGYDGRIHILTDTDGDGLEDHDQVWWNAPAGAFRGPIGMGVRPEGVYVASKGKVSLIRDTDGDGTADKEEIVATGWKEIKENVDALGIAFDKDDNLYFSLGCANYRDGYLRDKDDVPHYDLKSERGTILRLSPDRKKREIIATGIRFAVSLAFNQAGDLFCTEQEGDTWSPGNHLDELDHIIPGRHYGFPQRDPKYLPNTLDEPPVVGFGPQHQSTCGLKFNEPAPWRKTFGPKAWEGDALITGESRGKIWRTTLVKTPAGYVGRPSLIARTNQLTIDLAVSPKGDLVLCNHSGNPDWGTGPLGKGRLYKICYTDPNAPQPVLAWPQSNTEIRVAFDRPIDPSVISRLTGITVAAGEYVRAADRHETMRPGYEVVKLQLATPRKDLKIESAKLIDDNRTLVLSTEPMPWRSWYAVAVPGVKAPGAPGLGDTVDLDFQTSGVRATWKRDSTASPTPEWTGWLPHVDPEIAAAFAKGSAEHASFARHLREPGGLQIRGLLDLPGKVATVSFDSNQAFWIILGPASCKSENLMHGLRHGELRVSTASGPLELNAQIGTSTVPLTFHASYHTDDDPTERPLPLDRLLPPDAPLQRQPVVTKLSPSPLLAGGDWKRGEQIFFGNEAKCSACHTVRNKGGHIAPDLSNLLQVSPESVLNDILHPSTTINPDYAAYTVTLDDGAKLTGVLQPDPADPNTLLIAEAADKLTPVPRSRIKDLKPSPISLMPEGFQALGDQKLHDLLTFLTTKEIKK